jgi:N-acetylglucosaminyl-diphospho-decaprenol L-rhamnosyltransferase
MSLDLGSVTAVVLNWRTADLTERAVRALIADGVPASRIVVVDNGSGDGSAERLRTAFADARILALGENRGFAAANNAGAAELRGAAYLFVNSDAFVHRPGSVSALLRRLDASRAGLAVPRLRNPDLSLQPNVVPPSAPTVELIRTSGLSRFVPNRLRPGWSTHWDHATARRISAAIGAVVVVRADAWSALGGFDERRLMYAEDLDLFWRARTCNWEIWFEPAAEFVHLGQGTTNRYWRSVDRAARVAEAEAELIRTHMRPARARLTLAIMALGVGVRAAARRLRGDRERAHELAALARGYAASFRGAR